MFNFKLNFNLNNLYYYIFIFFTLITILILLYFWRRLSELNNLNSNLEKKYNTLKKENKILKENKENVNKENPDDIMNQVFSTITENFANITEINLEGNMTEMIDDNDTFDIKIIKDNITDKITINEKSSQILEELSPELGVTDPVSGNVIFES